MPSILAQIRLDTQPENLLSQVAHQIGRLAGADESLVGLLDGAPMSVEAIPRWLGGVALPRLDQSNALGGHFSGLSGLIPTDLSGVSGGLAEGIDGFFQNLQTGLTGQLSGVLDALTAVHELTQLHVSLDNNGENTASGSASASPAAASRSLKIVRRPGEPHPFLPAVAQLEDLQSRLATLPDPLTAVVFMRWLRDGLDQMPRSFWPLRYLPLLDELRDKLDTALTWESLPAEGLADQLASSLDALAVHIRQNLMTDGAEQLGQRLREAAISIENSNLKSASASLVSGLAALGQRVGTGNLSGSASQINNLAGQVVLLENGLSSLETDLFSGKSAEMETDLATIGDRLEAAMLEVLGNIDPPSDLAILDFASRPINELIEQVGFGGITDSLHDFFEIIRDFLAQLSLQDIREALENAVQTAVDGVNGLRNLLTQATVEITLLFNRLESAIESIPLDALVGEVRGGLDLFKNTIETGLETLFSPIREVLNEGLRTIQGFLEDFNPAILVDELVRIIRVITDLLSNPDLLRIIDSLRGALTTVNAELGNFHFRPVTDTVVDAIGIVENALGIAASIPMTDSMKSDFRKALAVLPRSIEPATDSIYTTLDEFIHQPDGPKTVLLAIRDKPHELVTLVEGYSPDQFIGENISGPYLEFLTRMESFRPGQLLLPVGEALENMKNDLRREAMPGQFIRPLGPAFAEITGLLDGFDPGEIIRPINDTLQAGIHALTDNLPLEIADDIFEKVDDVADGIRGIADVARHFNTLLIDLQNRLGGLVGADFQVRDLGDTIVAKLDGLTNLEVVNDALHRVGESCAAVRAAPLRAVIESNLNILLGKLTETGAKTQLVALTGAHRGFPKPALLALPNSPEKTALLDLLDRFDPLDRSFAAPIDSLERWQRGLENLKNELPAAFQNWDARFHGPQSPLAEFQRADLTADELKTLLRQTIHDDLTGSLAPFFKIISYAQAFLGSLLAELSGLVSDLDTQASGFARLGETVNALQDSIHHLVQALNEFDLSFLEDEINDVFESIHAKLDAINPSRIADLLDEAFNGLLDLLDLNQLLGTDELDGRFLQIVATLRENDPAKLVAERVQPEFEKVVAFLRRFDLSLEINLFLERIESLLLELQTELDRTAVAYDDLVLAVPTDLQGSLSASVSFSSN